MESETKESPSNKLIQAIAEHLEEAVVEMIRGAQEVGQRAESAEQKAQTADAAARDYESGLREIFDAVGVPRDKAFVVPDLLAEIQRLRANQIQPGDVVYRATGEARPPRRGDWFGSGYSDEIYLAEMDESITNGDRPIYRRIDAPGEQPGIPSQALKEHEKANTQATSHPAAPVAQEGGERPWFTMHSMPGHSVFYVNRMNEHAEVDELIATFGDDVKGRQYLNYLRGQSPEHARIAELTGELEKAKAEIWQIAVACGIGPDEAYRVDDLVELIKRCRQVAREADEQALSKAAATAQQTEAPGVDRSAAPAPPAEGGEKWVIADIRKPHESRSRLALTQHRRLDPEQAEAAADWLNRRADTERELAALSELRKEVNELGHAIGIPAGRLIADVPAKAIEALSALKSQAAAWEKVEKHRMHVTERSGGRWQAWVMRAGKVTEAIAMNPVDAVLQAAAQLEGAEGKGGV